MGCLTFKQSVSVSLQSIGNPVHSGFRTIDYQFLSFIESGMVQQVMLPLHSSRDPGLILSSLYYLYVFSQC